MQRRKKYKYKPIKIKEVQKKGELSRKKRMRNVLMVSILILIGLIFRILWIQFVMGSELASMAYMQQTLDRKFNPKRGTIYDSSGQIELAVSATVETVTINPISILKEDKEKVAVALSQIFQLDYEAVFKKVSKKSAIEIIVKKVDKEKTNQLRDWMSKNNISSGINIDKDTKRYYPYNNLASQIIGFCGVDNQGLEGIEAYYDKELKGKKGAIESVTNAIGDVIQDEGEKYIEAVDGNDLILTIDVTIQGIAEKYLEEACIDNVCTDGGNIIVMNPNNGDVLAIAGYPNYNLNDPYLIQNNDGMSQEEKTENLQKLWRNKAISDAYEPGSTFKLITSAAAIEEGLTTPDNTGEFVCTGGIEIAGVRMKCWRYYRPHGAQSLREALMNSCNPIFIGLGQRIGISTFYDYLEKFGLLNKTGIDLPGEGVSIFLKEEKVGPVELATISFGQRFEITPIQMITAVCSIVNGGDYVSPRIVKKIIDSETLEIKEVEVKKTENVISDETSKSVVSMMGSVVTEGTGKNAKVEGFSIGGKTGTSEDGVNTGKYVTSFIGVAPIEKPEVVVLITLYNPTGEGGHQGGGVAAPLASQIFKEVLPYLEINKNVEENEKKITVPNVCNITIKDAKKVLTENGLNITIKNNEEYNEIQDLVIEQVPKAGVEVTENTNVILVLN